MSDLLFRILAFTGLELLFHCNGQNNAFIPKVQTKVKTLPSPVDVPTTSLPTAERELWGLKLWQVVGIFLTGTIVIVTFSCCICDCRIPKRTQFEKDQNEEDEENDRESVVSLSSRSFPSTLPRRQNSFSSSNGIGSHSEVGVKNKSWQNHKNTISASSGALQNAERPSATPTTKTEVQIVEQPVRKAKTGKKSANIESFQLFNTHVSNGNISNKENDDWEQLKNTNANSSSESQFAGKDNKGFVN